MRECTHSQAVRVSVPGKIMLAGEYAVLQGSRCLSATVGARLTLDVSPSDLFRVRSNLWPAEIILDERFSAEPLLDSLKANARIHDVPSALVEVRSELDVSYGLGSSSAVRLASHLGLLAYSKQAIEFGPQSLWNAARDEWQLQSKQQGFASGYDLVTQVHGGYLEWQPDYEGWPGSIRPLNIAWLREWVHPYVGGAGASTLKVGGSVCQWLDQHRYWQDLQLRTEALVEAFLNEDLRDLVQANHAHRDLLQKAPFYPQALYKQLASIRGFDRSWTFKTTGAGGEDAILLLGRKDHLTHVDLELRGNGWRPLSRPWSSQGTEIHWKDQR